MREFKGVFLHFPRKSRCVRWVSELQQLSHETKLYGYIITSSILLNRTLKNTIEEPISCGFNVHCCCLLFSKIKTQLLSIGHWLATVLLQNTFKIILFELREGIGKNTQQLNKIFTAFLGWKRSYQRENDSVSCFSFPSTMRILLDVVTWACSFSFLVFLTS